MKPRVRFHAILALLILLLSACSPSAQTLILGKWEIEGANMMFEFRKDNTVSFTAFGQTLNGTYVWSGNGELEMNLNGRKSKHKAAVTEYSLELTNARNETLVYKRK